VKGKVHAYPAPLLAVLIVLIGLPLYGQVDTGSITGSVRDSNGAGLPNANVTFTETSTNATWKTQTDGSGNYVSVPLRPGVYKVTTELQGFKTQVRDRIALKVQDRLRVDFDMQIGSVSENVVVTADTPVVQTDTSSLGEVVTAQQITGLPLNGRDYVQ